MDVGENVYITCNTYYEAEVAWTLNNQTLPSDVEIDRRPKYLRIRNVQIHHNGTYRCRFTEYGGQKEMWWALSLFVGG